MLCICPAMEVLITNDRTGFEIVCAQHWEKNLNWVFHDVSKVPCEIRESNRGLTSIEVGISRQPASRFFSWAIGWTWWGSGRARTWRITSILWRLRPVHKRHVSARRHSGYWRIYGLVCVCLGCLCLRPRYGKTGRWMLRDEDSEACNLYTSRILDIIG